MRRRRKLLIGLGMLALLLALSPAFAKLYRAQGASDAPAFAHGDWVAAHMAAYDLRAPFLGSRLWTFGDPRPGHVVLFQSPRGVMFKRIVAGPGDTVALRGHRLRINGRALAYEPVNRDDFAWLPRESRLGEIAAREWGGGYSIIVAHPGATDARADFGPVAVPPGHYFALGSNRGQSWDSRDFGPISRDRILGRIVWNLSQGRRPKE